ncbi:MAG TPA: VWA domain-containing protein [Thermoanaerobaculia bacterium]|nr:VWA domain-containing protein [Thermoanaerobaculia bacterium]
MRHLPKPRFLTAALCAALLLPPALPAAAQGFDAATDVVVVEVPVQVVRDGAPVRGLTAADFEVYEGRKKQEVTGFEVIDLAAVPGAGARPALSASARRHFLLLFDLSNSESKSILKARGAAREAVLGKLHPSDLVAVATYSSRGPQVVLGFTPDRSQVERAIETLGVPELVDRNADPLKLTAAEVRSVVASGAAREREAMVLEYIEGLERDSRKGEVEAQRARVSAFTRSLADLAKLLNSVAGRKHVIFLSEGFDSSILTGTVDRAEQERMQEAVASGEFYNVDSDERYGSSQAGNALEQMLEEFRRADCVIQSVDIGGLRGEGDLGPRRASGQDALMAMAKDTGGEMYRNFNDLGAAMDQMLQRTGVTYVLAFQPERLKRDNSFHRLRVELKNAPRGTRVVHRPGYYAPRPFSEQSALEKLLQAANLLTSPGDTGTIPTAVLAAPFRPAAGEKAYVPVLVEVDGKALLAGKQGSSIPTEIYVYAFDGSGAVHDFLTQTVGLDLGKLEPALRQTGFKFFGHLDLLPGDYSVRVLVRNGVTGQTGLKAVPLTVPAFAQAGPVLLPPLFPEPPTKWVLVPETLQPGETRPDYPFMLQQQPYVPASRPTVAPGQEVQVSLVGYNLGDGELQAVARVTTPDGKEVAPATLRLAHRERGTGSAPDRWTAAFQAPGLQPGEYLLSVQLTGPAGSAPAAVLPFVVGSAARGGRS